ncbi:MAG: Hsp33 family molecular chaperone HslO, partial [Acutalibacteraceae bacterium]
MDRIIRCITSDGALMASAIDSSDTVYTAQSLHGLSATAAAALGRLLTGASMMGAMLKQEHASLTLR